MVAFVYGLYYSYVTIRYAAYFSRVSHALVGHLFAPLLIRSKRFGAHL